MQTASGGYMPGLDGLRALAVFAVIAYHLDLNWAPGGLLGVNLFFVLSGYLITNILLTQWEQSGSIDLRDFWLRRARRLLPGLFLMLAGVLLWVKLISPERLAALKPEVLSAVFYSSNWYLILHHVSYFEQFGPPSPLGHLWSLAVEEQFYLVWPLILGLGLRYLPRRKWIIGGTVVIAIASAVAMALIYMPGHDPSRVYYGTDTRAFALLAGAVLAMAKPSRKMNAELSGKSRLALDAAGSAGLLIVLWMIGNTSQYQTSLYRGMLLLYSVAAACLVAVLAHPASRLGRLFGWRPLRWLGECSYGIYLWHYPVIILTSPAVNTNGISLSRTLWQVAASIVLAAISRYLIEDPIRYGRRKQLRTETPDSYRRRKPLVFGARVSISILMIGVIMLVTAATGAQISAKEPDPQPIVEKTVLISGMQHQAEERSAARNAIKGSEITAVGDSLMLDVEPVLQTSVPGIIVDGQIGRQMYEAPKVIKGLKKNGQLGKTVIVELGANGSFTKGQLEDTLEALEGVKNIILVNTRVPRSWETAVNETLATAPESYPNVRLVDWYSASSGCNDYFYPDGVHLNKKGATAYGELIIDALASCHDDGQ